MNSIHTKCGGPAYANLTSLVKILSTFGLGTKSIKIGMGFIDVPKKGQYNINYFCPTCKKEIPTEEIAFTCGWCGRVLQSRFLSRLINDKGNATGDIICDECRIEYKETLKYSNSIRVSETLEKIYFSSSEGS